MWGLVLCKGGCATVEWVGMVFVSFTFRFVYTHARINDAHYSDGGKYLETNVHARQKPMRTYGWMDGTRLAAGCYAAAAGYYASFDIFSSSRIKSLKTFSSQTALRHDLTTWVKTMVNHTPATP